MGAPAIQIAVSDELVKIFWDVDKSNTYRGYILYYSLTDATMAAPTQQGHEIPNVPCTTYSKDQVIYTFRRSDISAGLDKSFYLRIKGVNQAGVTDTVNPGPIKYIPSCSEKAPMVKQMMYAYDPTDNVYRKVKVIQDSGTESGKLDTTT
jgi:hypothetical protein